MENHSSIGYRISYKMQCSTQRLYRNKARNNETCHYQQACSEDETDHYFHASKTLSTA